MCSQVRRLLLVIQRDRSSCISNFKIDPFYSSYTVGSGGILQAAVKLGGRRVRGIETLPEWAKKANEAISSTSSVSGSTGSSENTPDISVIVKN